MGCRQNQLPQCHMQPPIYFTPLSLLSWPQGWCPHVSSPGLLCGHPAAMSCDLHSPAPHYHGAALNQGHDLWVRDDSKVAAAAHQEDYAVAVSIGGRDRWSDLGSCTILDWPPHSPPVHQTCSSKSFKALHTIAQRNDVCFDSIASIAVDHPAGQVKW